MLKYSNIIQQLSNSDKISILCDIQRLSDKKYKLLGIPSVKIASLEDFRSVQFPTPIALTNSWDPKLILDIAIQQMQEMAAQGVDLAIIPGPRPKIDPYQAALSEDPLLSATTVACYISAAKHCGISVCLDGFYLTAQDLQWMDIQPDPDTLRQCWINPYAQVLKELDCAVLLTQTSPTDEHWCDINTALAQALSQQLQNQSHFFVCQRITEQTVDLLVNGGLCLSGAALTVETALNHYFQLCAGIQAGTVTTEDLNNELSSAQAISPEMLDKATDRLLDFAFNIKRKPFVSASPADSSLADQAAHSSIVLLKNDGTLPLKKKEKVCIIGDMIFHRRADRGATVSELYSQLTAQGITVTGTARGYNVNADRSDAMIPPALHLAQTSDVILLFLGLAPHRQNQCSNQHKISIHANQHALLDQLSRLGKKIVAVAPPEYCPDLILTDRCAAMVLSPLDTAHCAQALSDIFTGSKNPTGRLASTVYEDTDRLYLRHQTFKHRDHIKTGPFIGYRYYDTAGLSSAFPFGFGLSYSKFNYSQLTISNGVAQLTISNNSKVAATEIVQLYIEKPNSAVLRPKKELAGYGSITLEPGMKSTLQIPFTIPQVYDRQSQNFVNESGSYLLHAGTCVKDIRLTQKFTIEGQTLPQENYKISDYIQSESNIISNHFKLEAKHTTMKKSVVNYISGGLALLLACILKVYCGSVNVGSVFFDIFSIILAAAGVFFFILEAVNRNKSHNDQRAIVDAASNAEFTAAKAKSIPVYDADKMFVAEFDVSEDQPVNHDLDASKVADPDALAFIDKEQTFPNAAQDFAVFAEERGCRFRAESCTDLFASLAASRLLVLRNTDASTFQKFMLTLSSYFETSLYLDSVDADYTRAENLWVKSGENGSLIHTRGFEALQAAKNNPDKIYFVALDNVDPAQLPQYFTSCVKYVRNPLGEHNITIHNAYGISSTYRIPQNLWFVLNVAADRSVTSLPGFICDVAVVNRFPFEECDTNETYTQVRKFNYYQMDYMADKAVTNAFIPEDHWKKIDRLEKNISNSSHTVIDNKTWLCLEKYAHVYLTCEDDVIKALDHAICSKLLVMLIAELEGSSNNADQNLADILERILGEDGSIACKKLVQECHTNRA